jgi:hypothetical protein
MTGLQVLQSNQGKDILLKSILFDSWGSEAAKKRKMIARHNKIYFIRQGPDGPIKIGVSSRPKKRLTTLQTANPTDLVLLGIIRGGEEVEQKLHERFKSFLIRGEWYRPDPELLKAIRQILETGDSDI